MSPPWKQPFPLPFPEALAGASVTSIQSQEFADLLPASKRDKFDNLTAPDWDSVRQGLDEKDPLELLLQCLDEETRLDRLDKVYQHLWLAGRPMPPRPLHYQRTLDREIYITEKLDTHLVWCEGRIYIKPLPRFVLASCFWTETLSCKSCCYSQEQNLAVPVQHECPRERLNQCRARAWGLLFSYAGLVPSCSDFHIAKANDLLPEDLQWPKWRSIVALVLGDTHLYKSIDRRFQYGELRLNRLNKIYFYWQTPGKGYIARWNQYGSFFRDNFGFLASTITYIAIVLTAMQVGLATKLQGSAAFQSASYGFTIFAILGPLVALGLIMVAFLYLFASNWVYARNYLNEKKKQFDEGSVVRVTNSRSGVLLSEGETGVSLPNWRA
ncbi:hypothetical protein LZ30DRAFT_741592 [Colletotrichum cereale]|nr:hypothetical protein LZ30DRAFT_741592 [Colletotrichum cereale]